MKTDEEKAIDNRMGVKSLTILVFLIVGSVAAGVAAGSRAVGIAVFALFFAVFEFVEYHTTAIMMKKKEP